MTTASDVRTEIDQNFNVTKIRQEYDKIKTPYESEIVWNVYLCGDWLSWKMEQKGVSEQESEDLCFALGQQCWPNKDPYTVAADVYDRWLDGNGDKPGRELGERIFQEFVKSER